MSNTAPAEVKRRTFLVSVPVIAAGAWVAPAGAMNRGANEPEQAGAAATFPAQDPALVREIVGASHGREARVKELLKLAPRLANAAWDWGFGDWETALGAASHTGRRGIAELLLEHGARADVYCLAMLGRVEAVKAIVEASPGIQRVRGPHGLTLMHHARAGGDRAADVVEYLRTLGDADEPSVDLAVSDELKGGYAGVYAFGAREDERFEVVAEEKSGRLAIRRAVKDGTSRPLLRVGEHEFHPVGAPEVRVKFELDGGKAGKVTITSPAPVCEGRRV